MAADSITTPTQTKNTIVGKVHSAYNYSVFELLFGVGTTLLDKVTMFLEFSDNAGTITESNTYNYSVLDLVKMRRDVSQILKAYIKTICPLDFNVPAGEVVSDLNSFQMYRVCVVYNGDITLRTEWFYTGAGVFQKFHERKGNFIDYMVHIAITIDIYFGFPTSFRDAIAYRFNGKDTDNFAVRVDSGFDYVESYTDPISGIVVEQTTASLQPKLVAGGVNFDGVDDGLVKVALGFVPPEIWVVANSLDGATFTQYRNFVTLRPTGAGATVFVASDISNSNLFAFGGLIDNVATSNFAPLANKKSVGATSGATYTDHALYIGGNIAGFTSVNGTISEVLLFNRVLTTPERAELQTYLETLHSF